MSKLFCVVCNKETEYYEWTHKKWELATGIIEGWGCGRHQRVSYPEFVPDSLKEDRKKHFRAILQPFRGGEVSKEYIEAHGTKHIKATPQQIAKAKYVWKDLPGWSYRNKSK
jgi:hypothetical protein